jgi:hypothetical protein
MMEQEQFHPDMNHCAGVHTRSDNTKFEIFYIDPADPAIDGEDEHCGWAVKGEHGNIWYSGFTTSREAYQHVCPYGHKAANSPIDANMIVAALAANKFEPTTEHGDCSMIWRDTGCGYVVLMMYDPPRDKFKGYLIFYVSNPHPDHDEDAWEIYWDLSQAIPEQVNN